MSTVLIIAIVFGSIVAMQWIKVMAKEREGAPDGIRLSELEGRIEEAVTRAIAPLQRQVDALEELLERQDPARQLGEGPREAPGALGDLGSRELEERESDRRG